jgi:hypothetical protein
MSIQQVEHPLPSPAVEEPTVLTEPTRKSLATAFGCPRNSLQNRFVYVVVSPRARGLSIGVNLNPDKYCNFDCVYCEVNRQEPARSRQLDANAMAEELRRTIEMVQSGRLRELDSYASVPQELLWLRHVALSGDAFRRSGRSRHGVQVIQGPWPHGSPLPFGVQGVPDLEDL